MHYEQLNFLDTLLNPEPVQEKPVVLEEPKEVAESELPWNWFEPWMNDSCGGTYKFMIYRIENGVKRFYGKFTSSEAIENHFAPVRKKMSIEEKKSYIKEELAA